jgi:glycosyltransferase involved in cell wall biosynthesis
VRLPTPLTLEELAAQVPKVGRAPEGRGHPFWSVMIPTYESGELLRHTLGSVLGQDLGPERMQIEVVDGGSTRDDPEPMVAELGRGRVGFHRLPSNHGPAHTFNACIERARGRWVHILHGDDMVSPGFYEAYAAVIAAAPQARTIVGQSVTIDERGRWIGLYGPTPPIGGGVLEDFVARQATRQLVLFPSVVVARGAYEEAGGFCTLFSHVTDWDMWFRLGRLAPVACVSEPRALCRIHGESDTSRQTVTASNVREWYFVVCANLARLRGTTLTPDSYPWRARLAAYAEKTAWELDSRGSTEGRYNQARWAFMLEPKPGRLHMLAKSWLKHRLASSEAPAA